MKPAVDMLEKCGVACEARVISAHRATDMLVEYAQGLGESGLVCAIGEAGAANAALYAICNIAVTDADMANKIADFRKHQEEMVRNMKLQPE